MDAYKQAAVSYPSKLSGARRGYLFTKPFADDPFGDDFCGKLHDFAHIVDLLRLPRGSSILDVGCGPGWVTEFLGRLHYDVVGVDISPEMIRIARKRLRRLGFPRWGRGLSVRYVVADCENLKLGRTFDAAILHEALHHFADEGKVLGGIFAHLRPGARLVMKEPPAMHAESPETKAEVAEFGVLERGFTREHLVGALDAAGFRNVVSLRQIDVVVLEAHCGDQALAAASGPTPMHFLLAARPGPGAFDSRWPHVLGMDLVAEGVPEECEPALPLRFRVTARNTGDTVWLSRGSLAGGNVRLGVKLLDAEKRVVDQQLGWAMLASDVPPGESATLEGSCRAPGVAGDYFVRFDLVAEHITWFEGRGAVPLDVPLRVRGATTA
ncbi:MAG: class I SAM-dependent methyltransferase [Acidobacteriota bacterium]